MVEAGRCGVRGRAPAHGHRQAAQDQAPRRLQGLRPADRVKAGNRHNRRLFPGSQSGRRCLSGSIPFPEGRLTLRFLHALEGGTHPLRSVMNCHVLSWSGANSPSSNRSMSSGPSASGPRCRPAIRPFEAAAPAVFAFFRGPGFEGDVAGDEAAGDERAGGRQVVGRGGGAARSLPGHGSLRAAFSPGRNRPQTPFGAGHGPCSGQARRRGGPVCGSSAREIALQPLRQRARIVVLCSQRRRRLHERLRSWRADARNSRPPGRRAHRHWPRRSAARCRARQAEDVV